MTKVRGIIFDKDGTLFDFAATWEAWAESFLLRICGDDTVRAAQAGAVIGFDLHTRRFARDSIVIAGTAQEVATALAPHFPELPMPDLLATLNEEAANAPQAEAVPLVPLLTDLRARGIKLGVATNDAQVPARAHLNGAGVAGFFDFIAGFDSGHGGKLGRRGSCWPFARTQGLNPKWWSWLATAPMICTQDARRACARLRC